MKKKTVIALAVTAAAISCLAGCGNKNEKQAETAKEATETVQETAATEEMTEPITEAVTADPELEEVKTYPVTLPDDYSKVTYTKTGAVDLDAMTDEAVQEDLELSAEETQVTDREVKDGDTVCIDFTGTVDGEGNDAMNSEGEILTIGDGDFLTEFESQIPGHKPGENFEIKFTFPEDYWQEDMAGKEAAFDVTLNYIVEYGDTPELTDEWAKANTEFETAEEYRENKKQELASQQDVFDQASKEEDLISSLVSVCDITIPEEDLEEAYKEYKEQLDKSAEEGGYEDVEKYLEEIYGMTEEEYKAEIMESYEGSQKRISAVEALIEKEGLAVSNDDFLKYLKEEIAPGYGYNDFEEFKSEMEEYGMMDYFDDLYREHVAALFLEDKATEVEDKNLEGAEDLPGEIEISDGEEFVLDGTDIE